MKIKNISDSTKESTEKNWQKISVFVGIIALVIAVIFNFVFVILYINQKNITNNYVIMNDTLNEKMKKLQEEIITLKNTSSNKPNVSNLKPNEVEHNGTLKIRILKDSTPIPFIGYSISCAKDEQPQYFNATTEKVVEIGNCDETLINCKLSQQRWLLDRYKSPNIILNYNLEINGKIIPSNKEYIIETENDNKKSADYVILLKDKR